MIHLAIIISVAAFILVALMASLNLFGNVAMRDQLDSIQRRLNELEKQNEENSKRKNRSQH